MAQKTVGYTELEWTCKSCGTKNPGTAKHCTNCGRPMTESDAFEAPAQQVLISDPEKAAAAAGGADLICPFCGTRNRAGAATCTQCGGDLKGAKAREQGRALGAYESKPASEINCPACGTSNPAGAPRCKNCGASLALEPAPKPAPSALPAVKNNRALLIAGAAAILLLCACVAGFIFLSNRTSATAATVQGVEWQRSVQILELLPAQRQGWEDQIPAGAQVGSCEDRVRSVESEPVPGAEEVCGTAYTVDQGNGAGKVVQDCEYRLHDNYCSYTVKEWAVANIAGQRGPDLNPAWPSLALPSGQREGSRSETYTIVFLTDRDGRRYEYSLSESSQFAQFTPGSRWDLSINTFGSVIQVSPK